MAASSPTTGHPRWRLAGLCAALATLTFAVFGPTVTHDFVDYDDDLYVYDNPMVKAGLTGKGLVWAFTHIHSANWHPLTWISHMLDCQLYGLRPGGHHLTSVLLQAAAAILLFLVAHKMTGAMWRSAFVAALFAIHPLRVESVAWVAERKDVLSGLFFLLTMAAYVRYAGQPGTRGRYGLVALLFALGLMCKPMLVTLPLVLLVLDYWPLARAEPWVVLVLEKLPLLVLSIAGCVITIVAQSQAVHSGGSFSLGHRLGNAIVSCMVYLVQMVWPARLAVLYAFPQNGPPAWQILAATVLVAGISTLVWVRRRTQPWLLAGWLWYLIMLLPVLGIFQVGRQAHADRYTYLPHIGLYLAVTWWFAGLGLARAVTGGLMTLALAALMIDSSRQVACWKNSETLWTHALACTPDNDVIEANLGNALYREGRVDEALPHFKMAARLRPGSAEAHDNLGLAYSAKNDIDSAISEYRQALALRPDYPQAHYNLGNALRRSGKLPEAMAQYQQALQSQPEYPEAENNLASLLGKTRHLDQALVHYQKALALAPDNENVHFNFARALVQAGRFAEAIDQYREALRFNPADVEALANLAWLRATCPQDALRNGAEAVTLARQALQRSGHGNAALLGTLAAALAETGQFNDAKGLAQQAIRLAEASRQPELARQLQSQLQFYSAGHPYRQP